jgi:hypothetical protein
MSRNILLQHLRGLKANIPVLAVAETYLTTDTSELFIGTAGGNVPIGMPVFNAAGVRKNTPHIVVDTVTLNGSGIATVTLFGGSIFTSATSYICVAGDISAKNRAPMITQTSGSQLTFTGNAGDVIHFICIGN